MEEMRIAAYRGSAGPSARSQSCQGKEGGARGSPGSRERNEMGVSS